MLIPAIETSGREGSVALCRGDATSFDVLGLKDIEGGTYSARLMPSIADLLRDAKLAKKQVDGIVVVNGPGSFTGLRVGISTAKGLSEVLGKPLAAVSMLEALAVVYGRPGEEVTTVLDAGRGELYAAEYRMTDCGAELLRQSVVKLTEFLAQLPSISGAVITTWPKIPGARLVQALRADAIARMGLQHLLAGDIADPAALDANYIRRSDAELYSLPK